MVTCRLSVVLCGFGSNYPAIIVPFNFETIRFGKGFAYECGFDPFSDARGKFDVRFYLVSILFIIFDLEVTYLFPLGCFS